MKIYVFLICLFGNCAFASFPFQDSINAYNSQIYELPFFSKNCFYSIEVKGKYSQWGNSTQDSNSVDGAYYWETANTNNPILDAILRSLVSEPRWLGDSTIIRIPNSKVNFSFKNNIGFRLNGNTVPQIPYDKEFNTYRYVIQGNDSYGKAQILDSVLDINKGVNIPRYEDNLGQIVFKINEICQPKLTICNTTCEELNNGDILLGVAGNIVDLNYNKNLINPLLTLDVNGNKYISDSVACYNRIPYSSNIAVLMDASISMEEPIDEINYTSRLNGLKQVVELLLAKYEKRSFSQDRIRISSFGSLHRNLLNWTNNFSIIKETLDKIELDSSSSLYKSLNIELNNILEQENNQRKLIVLTDGFNSNIREKDELIRKLKKEFNDIRIVIVMLACNNDDIDNEKYFELKELEEYNSIKVIKFTDSLGLNNLLEQLLSSENQTPCCYHYFKVNKSDLQDYSYCKVYLNNQPNSENIIDVNCFPSITSIKEESAEKNDDIIVYTLEGNKIENTFSSKKEALNHLSNGFYIILNKGNFEKLEILK